jgi:hypothetical protein
MTTFWKTRGNGHPSFAMNTDATTSWLEQLFHNTKGDSKASILYELIRTTLQPDRLQRPSAQQIVDKIQDLELLFPSSPAFVENCCKGRGLNSDEACGFSNLNGFVDLTRCPEYLYPDALDSHTFLLVDPDGITFGFKENWPMEKSFGKHLDTYFKSPNDLNDIFDRLRKSVNLAAYVEKRAACELTVRSHEDGEFLARLSLRINSVNKLSFERTTCEIRLPVRSSEHRLRLVQVSIMPICFPRSELHGRPFFVISFMPDKEYDDDTNLFPTPPSTINCRIREWLLDCLKGSSLEKARYLNILEQNLDIFSISDFDLGTWEDLLVSFWDSDTSDSLPPLPPMDPLPTSHHNNQHPCADLGSTLSSTRFQGDDCQLDRICLQPTQIYDANSRFAGLPPLVNSYVYPTMINLVDGQAVVAPVLDMSSEETAESYLSSVYPWYLLDMEPAPGNKVPFTTSDDISRMDAIPMYQARDLLQTPHPQPFDSPLTSVAESHTDSLAERSLVVTKKPHRSLSIDLGRVNIRNLCTPEVRHARRWSISTSKDMCGKGNQEWEMIVSTPRCGTLCCDMFNTNNMLGPLLCIKC